MLNPNNKNKIISPNKIIFIIFLIRTIYCSTSIAQSFTFRHYGINEGLPSSEVYQVLQDSRGYIWFATNFGVSRFDGYKFQNFDNKDGLPDNTVLELYEDYKGRIWFISISAQLAYFKDNKITVFQHNKKILETIKDRPAITTKSFHVDSLNNIYIGIYTKGIYKVTSKGTVYKPYQNNPSQIKTNYLRINDRNIGYYESTHKPNMNVIKGKDTILITNAGRSYQGGSGIILNNFNKAGELLIFTREFIISISDFKLKAYTITTLKKPVISSYIDKSDNLWIGTFAGGVLFYPEGKIDKIPAHTYLQKESISSVLEDNEEGFWFTTLNNGVFYIPSNKLHSYTTEQNLSDNLQKSITAGNNGTVITSTGINENINFIGDSIIFKSMQINKEIINQIFLKKEDNTLWIGSSKSLYKTNLNNLAKIKSYELSDKTYIVNDIMESSDQKIWIATNYGIFKVDNEILTQYTYSKPFFRVSSIEEDFQKNLWLGTYNGLFLLQKGNITFKGYIDNALKNRITSLKKCNVDSSLWIATKGNGVIILKNNQTTELSIAEGLSSSYVTSLFIDRNTVWAGTNKGLDKITYEPSKKNPFSIEHLNQINGLISNEINKVFVLNKKVYVLTNMGITVFNSDEVKKNNIPPPIYITKLKILNKDTTLLKNYDLSYDQNFITISANGLTYKNPGNVLFKFKLNGLTENWQYSRNPIIQYQYIPTGNYTFEIYAMNEDGKESSIPAKFNITIHPPFWKTWWFFLSILVLVCGFVFTIYRYRIKEITTRQKLKDELNKYIQQALTKQMNPHFIFNSLNSIQNYILENDKRQSSKYLSKFAKLMRLVLENSQSPTIPLHQELAALNLYLELEAMRFNGKFTYSIQVSDEIHPETEIPALLIQPYIENSIWHGIMHKPNQFGTVTIDFKLEKNYLLCTITDDGIGRKKSEEINAEKRKNHKSFGTNITEKRIQSYNSVYGTKIGINYIDLRDEKNNPTGTKVEIKIHLKSK